MRTVITLSLTAAAAFLMPMSASAQYYGHSNSYQNNNGQLAGGLTGAVIGGVLGSNLAGRGVQDEGTAIGAVAGALIGSTIAGNRGNRGYYQGNNGYYNGGYYQQPRQVYHSGQSYGYSQPYYNQGYYRQSAPVYYHQAPV